MTGFISIDEYRYGVPIGLMWFTIGIEVGSL